MNHTKSSLLGGLALVAILISVGCGGGGVAREARHMATGRRYMEKKDYVRAVIEFRNAAQAAPASAEPHYQMGLALLESGDFRSAVAQFLKATELDPKHVGAQVKLAQLMATSNQAEVREEGMKRAQAAYQVAPEDVAALDAMAVSSWSVNKPEEAEAHLQQALRRMPGHLKSAILLANIKLVDKDYAAAEAILRKAAESAPGAPEPMVALGSLYGVMGKPAESERHYRQALASKPDYAPAMFALASTCVRLGKKGEAEELYKKISALPDKTFRPAYALFLLYLVDADRGIAELEKLYRAETSNRDIRNRLAAAYMTRERLADAKALLDAELKKNPKDVDVLIQRGQVQVLLDHPAEGEKDLNQGLMIDPNRPEARLALARIYGARGDTPREREELSEALRLRPDSLPARLALVSQLLRTHGASTALSILAEAPEDQRSDEQYLSARNWALLGAGKLPEAEQAIRQCRAGSQNPDFVLQDANLKLRQNNPAAARALLQTLLKERPGNLAALEMLMAGYGQAGQSAAGLQALRAHAAALPSSAPVQLFLATYLRRAGDFQGARAAALAVKNADSRSTAPEMLLAELDILEGQADSARRRLASLSEGRRSQPDSRLLLAMLEQQTGNYGAAIDHYRAVVAAMPRSVVALNNLAFLLVEHARQLDEGLRYAQQAQELAPEDPTVLDTIGWAFFRKGLYPTAVDHLQRAVARSARSVSPRYHLAMAYFKSGDLENAKRTLETAWKIDPRSPEARLARDMIVPPAPRGSSE